jgi:hypothetical protein
VVLFSKTDVQLFPASVTACLVDVVLPNFLYPYSNQIWLCCNQSSLNWELLTTSVVSGSSYALLLVQAPEFTVY